MTEMPPPIEPPQPPMTYPTGQYSAPPPGGNGWAIASLVTSILGFCVPFIGLLGAIFGFLGLRRAKATGAGNGLAIGGIVVGILTLLMWAGFTALGAFGYIAAQRAMGPAKVVARQYVADVSSGNTAAALAESSGISQSQIESDSAALAPLGTLSDMSYNSFNFVNNQLTVGGHATFANGTRSFNVTLVNVGGVWKVTAATFQ